MSVLIRLVGLVNGNPTPLDGRFLVEYDPTRPGVSPLGQAMTAHILCTVFRSRARRFANAGDAADYWRTDSGRIRPDGQPDRPLTAFNISIEHEEQSR